MSLPDPATFSKALGVDFLIICFLGGIGYWMITLIKKSKPDFKWWFKYKVMRKKYNEDEVAGLLEDVENNIDPLELERSLILSNKTTPDKAKELMYIFRELKKLKGGNVK